MSLRLLTVLTATATLLATTAHAAPKKVILVTATKGFRHSSIPIAENVIATLGRQSGAFTVVEVVTGGPEGKDDADVRAKMTMEKLNAVDGVIFANTTGDLAIPDRDGFLKWLADGHAFVGMHSCSDTFHGHPAFIEMLGGEFLTHKEQVGITAVNQSPGHPATRDLGPQYVVYDEIYIFKNFFRPKVHGLLGLDAHPNTLMPGDFPVAWCKTVGRGNVFYTSLGHREDVWTSDLYQRHILGGIKWAFGLESGDSTPQDPAARLADAEKAEGFKLLFDGKTMNGWKYRNPDGLKSWGVQNGMLVNTLEKDQHGTDILTEEKFRDFLVRYEYQVPPGANSGFYLRGRHEIQIFDDFGKKPEMGGNGAIYSVRPATFNASRRPGQWQTAEVKIVGQKVTVMLNGVTIHDNVDVPKATGGQLDDNLDQPGPILLQGDHGAVGFRNLRIKKL